VKTIVLRKLFFGFFRDVAAIFADKLIEDAPACGYFIKSKKESCEGYVAFLPDSVD
jgi:hypothetical protein